MYAFIYWKKYGWLLSSKCCRQMPDHRLWAWHMSVSSRVGCQSWKGCYCLYRMSQLRGSALLCSSFSFAFVPSIFPCCFVPCCSCRFFRFLFGSLFLIDTSGNQAGYVLKVYWLVSTLLWVATKEVTLSASSLLTKKDSMSFWRTSRTVCGALMLNLYSWLSCL